MLHRSERAESRSADRSELVLRGLAALLGLAFLVGVAACGGDEPDVQASVAMEPVVATPAAAPVETTPDPVTDPASTPEPARTPITREVSYDEAEGAYHSGEYGAAVDLFEAYTDQRPENPWGHYMLGLSAWKAGHLDLAELALTESVTLSPNHVKGRVNLARVLLEAGRVDEALDHATHAEDVDPTSVQARRTLARALEASGEVEEALAMYEQALWLSPEDGWSLNNMGYLLIQLGRYEEAVGPLALATTVDGDNPVFFNNLGHALEGSGHTVAAMRAFEAGLEEDVENAALASAVARLTELVETADVPELDVVAAGEAFRGRLAGAVDGLDVPPHGQPETVPQEDEVGVQGPGDGETINSDEGETSTIADSVGVSRTR